MAAVQDPVCGDTYWKEKYLQMEAKMSQFHIQASDIRNKLAVKISSLTEECNVANARADRAEEELRLLKEKLELKEKEKDLQITKLKEEVEHEKENAAKHEEALKLEVDERNEERVLVHEKIVRLKSWISARLEEEEDKKKQLFEANERATASLFEMKRRMQEMATELSDLKQSHDVRSTTRTESCLDLSVSTTTLSTSHSMDVSSSPPPVPPHGDRSGKTYPRRNRGIGSGNQPHNCSGLPTTVFVDDTSLQHDTSSSATSETISRVSSVEESKKESKSSVRTLQAKIEDIVIENSGHVDKRDLFSTSPKSYCDGKKKKKSATLPKTVSKKDHSNTHSSLIETFGSITRRFRGFTDSSNQNSPTRGLRRTQSAGKKEGKLVRSDSGSKKHVSTPQLAKELIKTPKLKSRSSSKTKRLSNTLEEEEEEKNARSEIMEVSENNSAPVSTYLSTSLPSPMLSSLLPKTKRSQSMRTPRKPPPTPPLHKVPVWETKILTLIKTGFELRGNDVIRSSNHDVYLPVRYHSLTEKTNSIYKRDLPEVPVYTKLFGKFILLRKTAFPDSVETSDDEEDSSTVVIDHVHHRSFPLYDSSTIPLRRNGSPGQMRAIKRANSSHSVTSSEGDYSIPPDALSLCSDSSEPEHKFYKTCRTGAPAAASSRVNSCSSVSPESGTSPLLSSSGNQIANPSLVQDKCGFLNKLSGFSLTWKKRWFVLKPNKIQYFLSPNDVNKKPLGEISLTNETKVGFEHDGDPQPVFHIFSGKRMLYLSAESTYVCDDWIRAINITLNRPRTVAIGKTGRYRSIAQNKIALKGWIERSSKDGRRRRLWACLGTSSLYFYTDEDEQEFVGRMILKDCKITPQDEETTISVKFPLHHGQQKGDVFLVLADKMEKDAWVYWLTVASGSLSLSLSGNQTSDSSVGTAFERLMTRIMYVAMCTSDTKEDSVTVGAGNPLWRDQMLTFSRESSASPITTLSSQALIAEAVKLIKSYQCFMNSEIDATSIDIHVTLAQDIASRCLNHHQLQGEIYAQLIKQCNGKFSKQTTLSTPPKYSHSKLKNSRTDDETAVLQVWKLLALLIPLFLPHQRLLWLLKAHLHRHADEKSEIGQYATYCQRALGRLVACGGRTSPPSRTETVSILLQNPFHHSLPFSIPVHFHNGKYQVIGFDASTTVADFTQRACQQNGIRLPSISGFALFTDDPSDNVTREHYISKSAKICDVISEWEKTFRDLTVHRAVDTSRMVKITLRQHLSFLKASEFETEKEKNLIVYQVASMISTDRIPVGKELAIELTALCAQIDDGDMRSMDHAFREILEKFYPKRFLEGTNKQQLRHLRGKLCERWSMLRQSTNDCLRVFLTALRYCPIYGCRLYQVENKKHKKSVTMWLAVHESGIFELNYSTMEIDRCVMYSNILSFGGYGNRLVLVSDGVRGNEKTIYSLSKEKAAEIVNLMMEYIHATMS